MTVQDPKLTDGVVTEPEDGKETEPEKKTQDGETQPSEAETEKDKGNTKDTAIGLIRKAESLLKEGQELPKDLMWTLPHLDVDSLKKAEPSEEESKEELAKKIKEQMRDEIEFENLQKLLPEDLDEETSDKMNSIIQREIELGKTSSQALKYAAFECGIPMQAEKSQEQLISEAHRFPRITPRKMKPKSSESEDYFMSNLPDAYKK